METDDSRKRALINAQLRGLDLLKQVELKNIIRIGQTEKQVANEILSLFQVKFGIDRRWHKEIVRSGKNTTATFDDICEDRIIENGDLVFIDLGPVLDQWEVDIGRTYLMGDNSEKTRLINDLPIVFDLIRDYMIRHPDISGHDLYNYACKSSETRGWHFGGKIAGHIVGEFSHFQWAGRSTELYIKPENHTSLSATDAQGRQRFWIIEVHLLSADKEWGGFYEQLAVTASDGHL